MWPFRASADRGSGQTRRVERLGARIAESKRLRPLSLDPDLIAVSMERTRRRTVAGLWFFLALGLSFTTTGVQAFLAGDATAADPVWWAAWTVEPMFAGLLILLLNFEAVILAHGVEPDHRWWTRIKRVLLSATLFMNVVPQLDPERFALGSLAVHLIIPVVVYGLAEVIPVIQARARQVVIQGYADAAAHLADNDEQQTAAQQPPPADDCEPSRTELPSAEIDLVNAPGREPVQRAPRLPAHVVEALRRSRDQAVNAGREFAPADVQRVINVGDTAAAAIHADLTARAAA